MGLSGMWIPQRGEEMENGDDLIYRQAAIDAVNEIINRFERILQGIRESKVDDSVCGMCEYDGAYIGQSGDWCNECPGFEKNNCFKLSDKCRTRWLKELNLPSAQPVIHCWECIYYDPEHIEKKGVRYEYEDMPKDAFDILGTGLVNSEYGINVGGRCCRDYNVGYSEDKRVFVSKQNYCGRAERRTDG